MGTNNKNPRNSRREFLKAASKLAVYTPPAMMVLADPSLVAIAESGGRTIVPQVIPESIPESQSSNWLSRTACGPEGSPYGLPNKNGSC